MSFLPSEMPITPFLATVDAAIQESRGLDEAGRLNELEVPIPRRPTPAEYVACRQRAAAYGLALVFTDSSVVLRPGTRENVALEGAAEFRMMVEQLAAGFGRLRERFGRLPHRGHPSAQSHRP